MYIRGQLVLETEAGISSRCRGFGDFNQGVTLMLFKYIYAEIFWEKIGDFG
jgi:hypothetical protein